MGTISGPWEKVLPGRNLLDKISMNNSLKPKLWGYLT